MFNIAPLLRTPTYRRKTVSFQKDEVIYLQGDRSDSIFYVEQGTVKLTVTSAGGKEALIGLYDGGHVFGEDCLAADRRYHSTCRENRQPRRHASVAVRAKSCVFRGCLDGEAQRRCPGSAGEPATQFQRRAPDPNPFLSGAVWQDGSTWADSQADTARPGQHDRDKPATGKRADDAAQEIRRDRPARRFQARARRTKRGHGEKLPTLIQR